MYELPYLGVIEVTGRDAGKYLQAQLAADIGRLQPGEASFAGLCQPQGRVIAPLLVLRSEAGYQLVCTRSLADTVLARLRPYVLRDDVQFDFDESRVVSGAFGAPPESACYSPLPDLHYAVSPGTETPAAAFHAQELQRGVAWLDPDHSGAFLPQMLGHEELRALSFRKGCFPGQEIIARTRYLGRLKQRAVVITTNGDAILDGAELSVEGDGPSAPAVLVDQEAASEGEQVAFVVARASEPFTVDSLSVNGVKQAASGRWLEVSSKRPDVA